jgi:RNA polymerase sigma-70 factor (ECF subfamily)
VQISSDRFASMPPQIIVDRSLLIERALSPTISARDGTRDARFRSMVDAHFVTVWRALRHLGVPEVGADDGAQQVFLVAARRLDEIREGGERPYLYGIALRVASEIRRAMRRRREVPMDAPVFEPVGSAAVQPPPDQVLDNKRALAMLATCLEGMSEKLREAFVLFELEELSAPEVARLLGVPVGTVASRVRLARETIRESLRSRGLP